ncbi:integrase/recombinase XerD [Prevotella dentalis DSM 3688]|uniref:Integrase/recombinase XerD n=1 Tax=Prevotella dentalis (strain ATCC 49559 / DSM 3688 / JCM 13448 / NCTC 12043 / ES 2772) TaxID=908937 RepID=F9D727_PREDD|nr:integrase/recombinase XerD [Prevotella dentalis DSM 3688]
MARHSFATLALAHDVPIENVARMLGHQNIRTTQIYAKVLKTTIERHAISLQKAIR